MKSLIFSIAILGIVGAAMGTAVWGLTTATVTTNVTAVNLAISRADTLGDLGYGSVGVGNTTSTYPTDGTAASTSTFQNDGSTALFEVDSANSTPGSWVAAGTTGASQFVHSFSTSTYQASGSDGPLDEGADGVPDLWKSTGTATTYQSASSTVDNAAIMEMWLQLQMPSSVTDYTEQSIIVTVQASTP